jgi:fibronectin-binding autotransporter adhesin
MTSVRSIPFSTQASRRLALCRAMATVFASFACIHPLVAQTVWDAGGGASDGRWSTAANWNNNIAPGNPSGTVLQFGGAPSAPVYVDQAWTVNGLQFNPGASTFQIWGTAGIPLTLNSTGTAINNQSNLIQQIGAPIILAGGSQTWTTSGTAGLTIGSSTVTNSGYTITTNAANLTTIAIQSAITGGGGVTVNGNAGGFTLLRGANTYSGATTVTSGTLNVNSRYALGTGTLVMNGGNLDNTSGAAITNLNNNAQTWSSNFSFGGSSALNLGTGAVTLSGASPRTITTNGAGALTVGGPIGDGASTIGLTKAGTGTLTLSGNNTFGSVATGVTLSAGTLNLNNGGALGLGNFTISGGTLDNTSGAAITNLNNNAVTVGANFAFTGTNNLNLGTGGVDLGGSVRTITSNAGNLILGGVVSNTGGIFKDGSGALTLSGTNTFTGAVTLNAGTLNLNNAQALGTAAGGFTINGGTLDNTSGASVTTLNEAQTWAGNFAFTGTSNLNLGTGAVGLGGATRTVTANAGTLTVGGIISNGALIKAGNGALTLSGANTFASGVTLNAGTLNINNAAALGTGTLAVAGGTIDNTSGAAITATNAQNWQSDFTFVGSSNLTFSGTTTLADNRAVTVSGNTLALGAITDGASSFSLTKSGSGALTLSGAGTFDGGVTLNAGTLNINNATALGTGTFTIANGTINASGGAITNTNNNAQAWNGDFTFTGSNTLNLGTGAVTLGGNRNVNVAASTLTVGGVIDDGASTYNLTKTGAGGLTLTGASTYGGTTTANKGTLTLSGGGTLLNSSSYVLDRGGTLTLDNSATNNTNRLGSVGLTANGGALNFTHGGSAGTNYSETIGALTLNSGGIDIATSRAAAGQTSAFTVASITANASATAVFSGTSLGADTRNQFLMTTAPTLTNGILPWAVHANGTTYNLATHGGNGTSIAALGSYQTGAENTWTATTVNARPSADQTLTSNRSLNALVLDSAIDLLNPTADRTLTFTGGAGTILKGGGTASLIGTAGGNDHILAFGTTEAKIFVFDAGGLTLNTGNAPAGITGSAGVTKDGSGTFTNNAGNANTGLLTINDGVWRATSAGAVSGGGVAANKGTLQLANNTGTTFTNTNTTVSGDFTITSDRTTTGAGVTHTLGTLAIGDQTLTTARGTLATSGTGGITFGSTTLSGNTVFNTGANSLLTLGALGDGGVARTITKSGTGSLTLNSAATGLIDATTVNVTAGTLTSSNATALGTLANITVSSGATFALGATGQTLGAFNGTAGTLSLGGNALTIGSTNNLSSSFGGTITGTGSLTKAGSGTLTLSGTASSYSGGTTIADGTLTISTLANSGSNSNIGTGNVTLGSGTTTGKLNYTGGNVTSNRNISLGGSTGGGNISANGTGLLTLSGAVTGSAAGAKTLTLEGNNVGTNTLSGAITNGSGTLALAKNGTGTWALSSAGNTYSGGTTVSGGNLTINNGAVLPASGNVTVNTGGTLNLNNASQTIGVLSGTGGTINLFGNSAAGHALTINDGGANGTFSGSFAGPGPVTKATGTGTLTLAGSSTNTGGFTISAGTLAVTNNSALGTSGGTTVGSGATLQLSGVGNRAINNGTLFLGSGATLEGAGTGVFRVWNSNITLTGNATALNSVPYVAYGVTYLALGAGSSGWIPGTDPLGPPVDASTINLGSNTLTLSGRSDIFLNGHVTGAGGLTVDMTNSTDTAWLTANYNSYTGTTTINKGTLAVYSTPTNISPIDPARPNFFGINGNIVIGNNSGTSIDSILTFAATYKEVINYTSLITINSDGQFKVNDTQTIGGMTFNGGGIATTGGNVDLATTGTLYLDGTVTVTAGKTGTFTGTGDLSMTRHQGPYIVPDASRIFDVGAGGTLDVASGVEIKNGSLVKNGTGTMIINSDNSLGYQGLTTVNNGILSITNGNALGTANGLDSSTWTIVNGDGTTNGTLQLSNNITTPAGETLTLANTGSSNTGFGGNGALRSVGNNTTNTWGGPVDVQNARIQSDSGSLLTLSGTAVTIASALTVGGAGNTTVTAAVGGAGTLTKNDSGTLILSGSNTYAGLTTVNSGGVLSAQSTTALGGLGSGTVVNSGGALHLDNTAIGGGSNPLSLNAEALNISGTGVSGTGALRSVSGPNTFQGLVTIGTGGALVTANSGHSLTLSGGTSSANNALTIGTTDQNGAITISGNMSNGTGALIKNGTGSLTFAGSAVLVANVGQVQLNAGTMTVGNGTHDNRINATDFDATAGTTLTIASGGLVSVAQAAGTTSTFAGQMAPELPTTGGEFRFTGADKVTSILALSNSFNASGLTLTISTGTLMLSGGGGFTFGTINITGDTILDFGNSAGTFLSSANLNISPGVQVTVKNWAAVADLPGSSTVWYATSSINTLFPTGSDQKNVSPLTQITFADWNNVQYPTTWVSNDPDTKPWFHREIRPTPEPATYGAMLLSGCLGLIGWRRYRSRKTAAA